MFKKAFIMSAIFALLLAGCQAQGASATATPAAETRYSQVVSVTGKVVPATWATISSQAGGEVVEVLVQEGDPVAVGAPLVLLDTSDLELALQIAEQEVAAQQATLDRLLKGTSEQVTARADRDNAYQLAQAEIALQLKQQQLAQARAGDPANDIRAARAGVRQLEAQIVQTRAQAPTAEVTLAQVEVERAKILLDDVQNEYNKALDRPWEDQSIRDGLAKQLKQAQLNYRAAQARLDQALNAQGAHALSLDVLTAQLEGTQAQLAQALDAQAAYSVTVNILETEIEAAQLQIDYLKEWENPYHDKASAEEIAQVQARLQQARLSVDQIARQIRQATLVAPFDGTVGALHVRVGEIVTPGQPLAVVGDLTTLRVETTDLDEIDVARVAEGQKVTVTFDALPDRVFDGQVTRVSPMAVPGSGGVNYTVIVEVGKLDPAVRWGMTAFVDIEAR